MGLVRVAAVQLAASRDVDANLAACLRLIDEAAAQGARLIVLPEFCNHMSFYADRAEAHRIATRPGDDFLTAIADRAARHEVYVKINVTHAYADGRTGGTNFLFGPDGKPLAQCDKQTLMGAENDHLDPATEAGPVVDTPLGRLGMYACMEGVINEVARGLALRGAQVLLNSLNSFALDEASLHIPVRAAENKTWVVAANKVGPLLPEDRLPQLSAALGVPAQWLHGAGESQIVAPDGTVVAKGPRTGEAVVVADIDPDLADAKQRPDGVDVFAARRPEIYRPIAEAPQGRRRDPGAPTLPVAVVRGDPATVYTETAKAAADGVLLVVTPEADPARLAEALAGTPAYAVTATEDGVVLVDASGVVGVQPPLHACAAAPGTELADGLRTFDLPWGRLALIGGLDTLFPEAYRLAALADADVVASPFTAVEDWELSLGLPERAAENRLNVVAAAPLDQPSAIFALSGDFTLWTAWQGPFTGRISHPLVHHVPAGDVAARADVAPAQAANRLVSRRTDLVDGRPWRLLDALTER
ncbi:nitrilase-related carbon-nitrogen hydrolase [Hamadaea sp. NPDC051192]|uniref:nitrilase-related carbon-nitrogen hydrolase n=1 Tax=Hamadaea sp. NPDC051192 TaxID=3154940 RepID=UPI003431047B